MIWPYPFWGTYLTIDASRLVSRTEAYEADMYGLNAAREPNGRAKIDLKRTRIGAVAAYTMLHVCAHCCIIFGTDLPR